MPIATYAVPVEPRALERARRPRRASTSCRSGLPEDAAVPRRARIARSDRVELDRRRARAQPAGRDHRAVDGRATRRSTTPVSTRRRPRTPKPVRTHVHAGRRRRGEAAGRRHHPPPREPTSRSRSRVGATAGSLSAMADKITMSNGVLVVPDEPIIPFVEGDGTGVDIWPAAQLVMDAAAAKHGKTIAWKEVLAGPEGVRRDRLVAPRRDRRHVPRLPDRDQGPAHHADRRRHPLAQRRAAPAARPLRVPAPGALVQGRAVAGEAPRAGRHGDLPGEHRGHLRRPRGRGGHARGEAADRDPEGGVRLGHPRRLRRRHQADLRDRFEAPDPRRDQVRGREGPQVGHARAQGQHPEVHRGRVHATGATS